MIERGEIVRQARTWLGTPFHHQGRLKGVGVDCAGLVICVAWELGIAGHDITGYGRRPDSRELERLCREQMVEVKLSEARPGDVYLLEVDKAPQHLAFATDVGLLHSYAPARRVVEHRMDADWAARRVAAFSLPDVC